MKGLGIDIVEIPRIRKSLKSRKEAFINRVYTPEEIAYCRRFRRADERFAGRFAAKEAVAKALGLGIGSTISWQDIEILNDEQGQPYVKLGSSLPSELRQAKLLISISHCKEYATAVAARIE